jgi:hypothetical protein
LAASQGPSQGDGVLSGTGFIMGKTQTHIENGNKVDNATQSSMQMCQDAQALTDTIPGSGEEEEAIDKENVLSDKIDYVSSQTVERVNS